MIDQKMGSGATMTLFRQLIMIIILSLFLKMTHAKH